MIHVNRTYDNIQTSIITCNYVHQSTIQYNSKNNSKDQGSGVRVSASYSIVSHLNAQPQSLVPTLKLLFKFTCYFGCCVMWVLLSHSGDCYLADYSGDLFLANFANTNLRSCYINFCQCKIADIALVICCFLALDCRSCPLSLTTPEVNNSLRKEMLTYVCIKFVFDQLV